MDEGDSEINEQGFPIDLDYGKFKFVKILNSGSHGVLCLYNTLPQIDNSLIFPEQVAVKFYPTTDTANLTEMHFLRDIT
jgi:hypothetical protein